MGINIKARVFNDIKQTIKERTTELSNGEYLEFLSLLSMWVEDEINIVEY